MASRETYINLKATTYIRDNYNIHVSQLQSNGRHKHFNEVIKLNGVEFNGKYRRDKNRI